MRWPTPSSWSCKRQHTSRYVVAILLCRVVALAVIFVATGIGCLIVCRLVRLTPIWFRRCKLGLQGGPIITGTWRKYFLCYNDSNLTPIPHPNKMWGHLERLEPYRTILAVTRHYSLRIESWAEFGDSDVVNWCCQRDQNDFFFNFKRSFSSVEAYSSRDIIQGSCFQLTTAFFNSVSWSTDRWDMERNAWFQACHFTTWLQRREEFGISTSGFNFKSLCLVVHNETSIASVVGWILYEINICRSRHLGSKFSGTRTPSFSQNLTPGYLTCPRARYTTYTLYYYLIFLDSLGCHIRLPDKFLTLMKSDFRIENVKIVGIFRFFLIPWRPTRG